MLEVHIVLELQMKVVVAKKIRQNIMKSAQKTFSQIKVKFLQ